MGWSDAYNRGVVRSFEWALTETKGEYIFFSDQDDIWLPNKVRIVLSAFDKSGALAIVTDSVIIGAEEEVICKSFFAWRNSGPGFLKNFYKNTFLGCCMAIRKECKRFLLPFPRFVPMHDEWVGLTCSIVGNVYFIPEKLLAYRRHKDNVTAMHRSGWGKMFRKRINLVASLLLALPRLVAWKCNLVQKSKIP